MPCPSNVQNDFGPIEGQGITVYSIYCDSSSNKKGKFLSGDEKIAEAHSWVGLSKREAAAL